MHDSVQIALQAKAAGADGCLVKSAPADELLKSIATILDGHQKH